MLIINADDWGRNTAATDNSLICFKNRRITSVTAMLFMADSPRAAELALQYGLDVGLHLNFTLKYDGVVKSGRLIECQQRIASFINATKYNSLLYNPFIIKDFRLVFEAQFEEFMRLYRKAPTHIDGHHHMHLCTNMLCNRLIPKGTKVRRSFTFFPAERDVFNRSYRYMIDLIIKKRYTCTDYFFSFWPPFQSARMQRIVDIAKSTNVELMVHPERKKELDCLLSDNFFNMISSVKIGNYALL